MSLASARLIAAKHLMATTYLRALPASALGSIELRDDQRRIVARAERALATDGGCLIGEGVGRGKTFIALALARAWRAVLVVAPASLRTTWRSAMQRTGVLCDFVSHESLSRDANVRRAFDAIIVDESHHFRTTTTRRYAALSAHAAAVPLILLSATPLQNRLRDLAAQVALFFGESAFTLTENALARFVIRGDSAAHADLPVVAEPEWVSLSADDSPVLSAILSLPEPARPLDGGNAATLRTISLVRAWASSRAALQSTLRARRRLATAIEQGVDAGRTPTRLEARAWRGTDEVVQLGFAEVLMGNAASDDTLRSLRLTLEQDRASVAQLSALLAGTPDPDAARITALRNLRERHAGQAIIAFSEFASTVNALHAGMRHDAGVGSLTAHGARIANANISRDEILALFAPRSQHASPPSAHQRVTLLITTDLLSEGVNLQDAGVVVHIDLPWNPARLAQRVGRVRRPGGHAVVHTYLIAPPASAATLLDVDARLRRKISTARSTIGPEFDVLPALTQRATSTLVGHHATNGLLASAADHGALVARLTAWCSATPDLHCPEFSGDELPIVAAANSSTTRWLAMLDDGRLVASLNGSAPNTGVSAIHAAAAADSPPRDADAAEACHVRTALDQWLEAEFVAHACGIEALTPGPLRLAIHRRLDTLLHSRPRHRRSEVLPLIAQLRAALNAPLPLGAEQQIARLATATAAATAPSTTGDDGWLTTALNIATARRTPQPRHSPLRPKALAIILCAPLSHLSSDSTAPLRET